MMMLKSTPIDGLWVAETEVIGDDRGTFARWFCQNDLGSVFGDRKIVQINHSRTERTGVVRGMHFQYPPHAEMKLIRCIRGRIWDVAIDLRKNSKTFLRWHAEELSAENGRMIILPEGFAHGFQVLEGDSELLYLHTAFYSPEHESGVRHDDPIIGIEWPLPVTGLSEKDKLHPAITKDYQGLKI